ncbi:MAG: hypothetical protein LBQ37_02675 [Elusimicrobiota bacterium]|jgi:hypothetical protein|nr:hypothetical protein [Elusimicrobiota bacterium]
MQLYELFRLLTKEIKDFVETLHSITGYAISHIYRWGEPPRTPQDTIATGSHIPAYIIPIISKHFRNNILIQKIAAQCGGYFLPIKSKEIQLKEVREILIVVSKRMEVSQKLVAVISDGKITKKEAKELLPLLIENVSDTASIINYLEGIANE